MYRIFQPYSFSQTFVVQVLRGEAYSELADRQYVTPLENIYERGTIFFKVGIKAARGTAYRGGYPDDRI